MKEKSGGGGSQDVQRRCYETVYRTPCRFNLARLKRWVGGASQTTTSISISIAPLRALHSKHAI